MIKQLAEGVFYREDTTDFNCLKEVLGGCYEMKKIDFKIEEGEHWLDLGGNIGAFGIFCNLKGATCESYEPSKDNFKMMLMNYKSLGGGRKPKISPSQILMRKFLNFTEEIVRKTGTDFRLRKRAINISLENSRTSMLPFLKVVNLMESRWTLRRVNSEYSMIN